MNESHTTPSRPQPPCRRDRDFTATELRDIDEARLHAIKFAAVVLGIEPELLSNGQPFHVEVRAEMGELLMTMTTQVVVATVTAAS